MFTYVHKTELEYYKQYAPVYIREYRDKDAGVIGWIFFNFPNLKGMPWIYSNYVNESRKIFVGVIKIPFYHTQTEEKQYRVTAVIIAAEDTGRDIGFELFQEGDNNNYYYATDYILNKLSPLDELFDDDSDMYDYAQEWREKCRQNNP